MTASTPRDYAGFQAQPFIHSILKGAVDGVEGVGILTDTRWIPSDMEGSSDVWGDTWIQARANWIKEVRPYLLSDPRV
jgi:hypothetical protein